MQSSCPSRAIHVDALTSAIVLLLALASTTAAQTQTPSAPDNGTNISVNVELVRLAVSATDHGVPIKGLAQDEFQIREDGVPQRIKYFWQESDLRLSVGLIADVSGSQAKFIHEHKQTLLKFLDQIMRPQDRAMLVTVGPQARLIADFTDSHDVLADAIDRIQGVGRAATMGRRIEGLGPAAPILGEPCLGKSGEADESQHPEPRSRHHSRNSRMAARRRYAPCGGTALWNGIYWAARLKMRPAAGRNAIIVLSDGMDTGSDHNLEDAIE